MKDVLAARLLFSLLPASIASLLASVKTVSQMDWLKHISSTAEPSTPISNSWKKMHTLKTTFLTIQISFPNADLQNRNQQPFMRSIRSILILSRKSLGSKTLRRSLSISTTVSMKKHSVAIKR